MIQKKSLIMYAVAVLVTLSISFRFCDGFTVKAPLISRCKSSSTTSLKLEDWVADMIDTELYRQRHIKEYQEEWMVKNKGAVLKSLNDDATTQTSATAAAAPTTVMMQEPDEDNFRQKIKDRRMAQRNPQQYCADRCVATGNCDVYEDLFNFTPEEVMAFCNDCVLADDNDVEHDHCDIPETFYDNTHFNTLKP